MSLFAGFQERYQNPTTQININELRARENFTEIENAPGSLCAGGGQTLGGHVRLVPTGDRELVALAPLRGCNERTNYAVGGENAMESRHIRCGPDTRAARQTTKSSGSTITSVVSSLPGFLSWPVTGSIKKAS